jgi:hypothetical protein
MILEELVKLELVIEFQYLLLSNQLLLVEFLLLICMPLSEDRLMLKDVPLKYELITHVAFVKLALW